MKALKANELMVGDWVNYSHSEDGIAPFVEPTRIVLEDLGRDEDVFETHYHPIPLSPEILEKNGFKNVSVITVGLAKMRWVSEDTRTEITIWIDDTMPMEIVKNVYYEDEVSYTLPFPGCVHELQHALRLCGIEKDITL